MLRVVGRTGVAVCCTGTFVGGRLGRYLNRAGLAFVIDSLEVWAYRLMSLMVQGKDGDSALCGRAGYPGYRSLPSLASYSHRRRSRHRRL